MTANALTVDVEEYFQIEALTDTVDRAQWDRLESRVEFQTHALLDLFAAERVRATFFTLGWVARRHPSLVRRIVSEGHELASHGDAHRMITKMSREAFREDITTAKHTLEDTAGVAVTGYRAPTFSVVRETLWALDELVSVGFDYDASIYPIRHDRYGIPDAPRQPHTRAVSLEKSIVEFPSSTVRLGRKNLPIGGGGYLRLLPMQFTRWGLHRIASEGPFMVYLHPWELDPRGPRFALSPVASLRTYHNLDCVEPRLTELLRTFPFDTARACLVSLGLLEDRVTSRFDTVTTAS